jgi:plastocyanin
MMQSHTPRLLTLATVVSLAMLMAGPALADATAAPSSAGASGEAKAAAAASASEAPSDTVVVIVKDYKFIPEEITVPVGTTVRWENHERRQYHNVYFEGQDDVSSDYFFPEEYRERTFDKPGTYPYICEPHIDDHDMKGVVHVVE